MHNQLETLVAEFQSAQNRLHRLVARVSEPQWNQRPRVGGWSAAECIAHLNLTSSAYLPLLTEALDQARSRGGSVPARLRRDLTGWLLWKASGPSGKMKVNTAPGFVPGAVKPRDELVAEFERLQVRQIDFVRSADGLPVHRVKISSPFNPRIHYSLYSALTILAAHQHRHLGQAEQAIEHRP